MKMYNKIYIVLIFVSLFLLTSCVCATDNITDDNNGNNSEFNVNSNAGVDLNNLINCNESEDEIILDDDYVFEVSKDGINNAGIKINRSVTIDGRGHTIDGINFYRTFDITADNVILKNIQVINSGSKYGSYNAVSCKNSTGIFIINVTFINCGVSDSEGAISFKDSSNISIINSTFIKNNGQCSGAVYFENSHCFIMNSTFIGNSGTYGGAIQFGGGCNGSVVNSSFYANNYTKNYCKSGGAIDSIRDNITIDGCIFVNNNAYGGGAIRYYDSAGTIVNSIFINNTAYYSGGSISCDGHRVSIINSTFNSSSVKYHGGAIFYLYNAGNSVVNSTFIGNNATYGGGIYFKSKLNKAVVENCLFKDNYAEYGAAISTSNQTTKNVVMNSIFIENKAQHNGTIYGINIINCTILKIQTQLYCQPVTTYYNDDEYLIIVLEDKYGVKISNISVNIDCGSLVKSLTTDNQGVVKFSTKNLIPKSYNVIITFNGNDIYENTSIYSNIIINKANLKIIAKKKTFKAKNKNKKYTITLKDTNGNKISKTKIILKIKGKTYKTTTNNGKATFKITKLNKKGKYKAKIIFKGDKYYSSANKNVKIVVK